MFRTSEQTKDKKKGCSEIRNIRYERKYMIKILYEDRKIIEEMYNSQMPINRIADRINVARSTLYRELRREG